MSHNDLDQFKRMLRALAALLLIIGMSLIFLYIWRSYYNLGVVFPFYYKGHWLVTVVYAIFVSIFFYIYGGLKFGYLTCSSIILSQVLAIICANVLAYLEIVLLSAQFVSVFPILLLTGMQIIIILIWTFLITFAFDKIFPPRRLLLLYEEYNPSIMEHKIKSRNDRYKIELRKNIKELSEDEIHELIKQYDSVLI